MSKLLVTICLLGIAASLMIGGCTPDDGKTWSESADFSELDVRFGGNISGSYEVDQAVEDNFVIITLIQTGSTIQGYDNMGRSWLGTLSGSADPMTVTGEDDEFPTTINQSGGNTLNLQTGTGTKTTIVAAMEIFAVETLSGVVHYTGFAGMIYKGERTGYIEALGRIAGAAEEE